MADKMCPLVLIVVRRAGATKEYDGRYFQCMAKDQGSDVA